MSEASDRDIAAKPEIPKIGFRRGGGPPGGGRWMQTVQVGDVLVDAVRRRHVVRKVFKAGLRIDFDGLGPQDWGWHALMTLGAVPADVVETARGNASTATAGLEPPRGVVLGARFRAALDYACEVHSDQRRQGPEPRVPYLGQVLGVCSIVIDDDGSEDEAIASLLYDAVEGAGGEDTLQVIRTRFGKKVARIVEL